MMVAKQVENDGFCKNKKFEEKNIKYLKGAIDFNQCMKHFRNKKERI